MSLFLYPWLLLLILPVILMALYAWFRKQPSIRVPSLNAAKKAAASGRRRRINWKRLIPFLLYTGSMVLLVVAFARPREGLEQIRRRAEGIDIILALDLSGSMVAVDVPKQMTRMAQVTAAIDRGTLKNRIQTAKEEIAKFIQARPNDRIGLIAFAPLPYMACPPTLDHAWLLANLENLDAGIIGDKTNIAAPITSAVQRLKDSDARRKIIVLFTDGSNNVEAKVTPLQAAKLANTFDITVYTVGIGSPVSVAPVETFAGRRYEQIQSDFDEPLLRQIAEDSGGKYYKAEDSDSMAAAMKAIDSLEKTSFEQQTLVNWRELAPGFTAASLILLLLAFLLENTVMKRIP